MREQLFARLLIIILPATLVLTWISKLLASDSLRRDALGELTALLEDADGLLAASGVLLSLRDHRDHDQLAAEDL